MVGSIANIAIERDYVIVSRGREIFILISYDFRISTLVLKLEMTIFVICNCLQVHELILDMI